MIGWLIFGWYCAMALGCFRPFFRASWAAFSLTDEAMDVALCIGWTVVRCLFWPLALPFVLLAWGRSPRDMARIVGGESRADRERRMQDRIRQLEREAGIR